MSKKEISKKECPKCHKLIGATAYKRHINSCNGVIKVIKPESEKNWFINNKGEYECKVCHKICSRPGIGNHVKYHFGYKGPCFGKTPYLKGKTYDDYFGIEKSSEIKEKLSETMKNNSSWKSKDFWTEERRKSKSLERINYYKEHPEKHQNRILAGNKAKMNYPEKLVFDKLTELGIVFEHQKRIGTFYVDFYIEINNKKYFIEVDGKYFHNDLEKDKIREDKIKNICDGTFVRLDASNVITELNNKFISKFGS